MRFVLVFVAAIALFILPASAQTNHLIYLPSIQRPAPDPASLIFDSPGSEYKLRRDETITNEGAAQTFRDPAAALVAFTQQGRETAYWREWQSSEANSEAGIVSVQVNRYLTPEGAKAGAEYLSTEMDAQGYGYGLAPFDLRSKVDTIVERAKRYTENKRDARQFVMIVQKGRFVAVIGTSAWLEYADRDRFLFYVDQSIQRLP